MTLQQLLSFVELSDEPESTKGLMFVLVSIKLDSKMIYKVNVTRKKIFSSITKMDTEDSLNSRNEMSSALFSDPHNIYNIITLYLLFCLI